MERGPEHLWTFTLQQSWRKFRATYPGVRLRWDAWLMHLARIHRIPD